MKHTLERRERRIQGTKSSLEEMVENKKDETGLSLSLSLSFSPETEK